MSFSKHTLPGGLGINATPAFSVVDPPGFKQPEVAPPAAAAAAAADAKGGGARASGARAKKGTEASMAGGVKIGGEFTAQKNPEWLQHRMDVWDRVAAKHAATIAAKEKKPITITLPDGSQKEGTSWETSPMDIANGISSGLARTVVVARVKYAVALADEGIVKADGIDDDAPGAEEEQDAILWDATRPLEGDCALELLKYSDKEGKTVFWHSSAHMLGQALEHEFGGKLTHGPALDSGFFYDCYLGDVSIGDKDWKALEKTVQTAVKAKLPYERIVISRSDALELFKHNPFKVQIITSKVPEGTSTTCYRQGDFIDLCMGPHVPSTGMMKAFQVTRNSSAYWLGEADNDSLQRVYGIAFPDKKELKAWKKMMEEAAKRDHRKIGTDQELFFFHQLSPGSAFMQPHGARLYNTLVDFIKKEYWQRGYTEVMSPNVFNFDLWHTSGHALHYKENMFCFDVEGAEFGLKPMNCPGHCLMFAQRLRSYRELPMRYADFGVLHRNELSGALTGLTRVRRFQQDDAHVFCRRDQITAEVEAALHFMKRTYDVFGMTYMLELSTRPKKALGDMALWDEAEAALAEAMDNFAGPGNWKVNPGDGAFYGPKIDIQVFDALGRDHQCATIQLDFQLPIRFNLRYRAPDVEGEKKEPPKKVDKKDKKKKGKGAAEEDTGKMERPIIVHRAMLGSVERMMAILIEHYAGKWPFWLSPRQCMVVPITTSAGIPEYALEVKDRLHKAGFFCDADVGSATLNKKVRAAQLAQYNYILVVGATEKESDSVNIRTRADGKLGIKTVDETIAMFQGFKDDPKHEDL